MGISYVMLEILSGIVTIPKTEVREVRAEAELVLSLDEGDITAMQLSADGAYLAYIARGESGETELRVLDMEEDLALVWSRVIKGDTLAWLGSYPELVYEDGGDISILDMETSESINLTQSEALDYDPLPTPDGRRILWANSSAYEGSEGSETPELQVMDKTGSDKRMLATYAPLAIWDPEGLRVLSKQTFVITEEESENDYLQVAEPGGGGWELFTKGKGEVHYIWWPRGGALYYITTHLNEANAEVRGLIMQVDDYDPAVQRDVASTDSLGYREEYYTFYPSRVGERLAYVGSEGLECLDMEDKIIQRFPDLEAETPLAWEEGAEFIYFVGPDGIYRVSAEERPD
ncbi:MAG: hypothetical protein SWK76_03965 [Actinomycetota bacterium]|nr:hypothetical protein [Actinomycetota bacterium]